MNKWIFLFITFISQLTIEAQISDFKNIKFKNADKIAYAYKGNDLNNLPGLAYNLTYNLPSDVEKFKQFTHGLALILQEDYNGFKKSL